MSIENKMVRLCSLEGFTIDDVTQLNKLTENDVLNVERKYGLELPAEYKWFISKYGGWGLDFELLGIVKTETGSLVFQAMDLTNFRKTVGFPDDYLVIEDAGEFQYCLNLKDGSVGVWERAVGVMDDRYASFLDYLEDRLDDCIDNAG